jgi:hypothetical protein
MPPHGRHRRLKPGLLVSAELKRCDQPLSRVAIRTRGAAFELLDAMHTQASPFGQCLLRQAGRLSMLTEQFAKGGRRAGEHSRASLSQGVQRAGDPPASTPA